MPFDEQLSEVESDVFSQLTGGLEQGVMDGLMLDVSHHLHRLAEERRNRPVSWFDYHSTWINGSPLEVVITERYDPANGEKLSRVITRSDGEHEKGKLVIASDGFVAPETSRCLHEDSKFLILPGAKNWPLGPNGRPVIIKRGDEVELVSGAKYNHYPQLPKVSGQNFAVLTYLQELNILLSMLGEATAEPHVQPGNGEF